MSDTPAEEPIVEVIEVSSRSRFVTVDDFGPEDRVIWGASTIEDITVTVNDTSVVANIDASGGRTLRITNSGAEPGTFLGISGYFGVSYS